MMLPEFTHERISFVCLIDLDRGGRSVTNGIEDVIDELYNCDLLKPDDHVIYRDSEGIWDEVLIDDMRFADFRRLNAKTRDEAIARVLELEGDQ